VARDANKTQVKQAVEKLFKVKVAEVRTATFDGKLRRRGRFAGYRSDWKKAYVKLKRGRRCPSSRRFKPCRLKNTSSPTTLPTRRFHDRGVARGHHQGTPGKVAGGSQEAHRRPQQHGPRHSRFIGGGHKQAIACHRFQARQNGVPAVVASIEYDPNRSARIALLHYADGEKRYIIAAGGLKVGMTVSSGPRPTSWSAMRCRSRTCRPARWSTTSS
jgi:hypothetical protein